MNEKSSQELSERKDQLLYEDISQFIKIFRKIFNRIEKITYHIQQESDFTHELESIQSILSNNEEMICRNIFEIDEEPNLLNTYYRFIYRINQIVVALKKKFYNLSINIPITNQIIKKVQQQINKETLQKNIGQLFRTIFNFIIKFCTICKDYTNNRGIPQSQLKVIPFMENNSLSALLTKPKFYWNKSQSNYKKTINKLNYRFFTLGCLDIQYNFFKNSFFSVKNDSDQFHIDYLRRNEFVKQQINIYSKQFRQYLKKKQRMKLMRKNRLIQDKNQTRNNLTTNEKSQNDKNEINTSEINMQGQSKISSYSQTNIKFHNTKKYPYKTSFLLKQMHQQKRNNFLKLKNVSIGLSHYKYEHSNLKNHKNVQPQENNKNKKKYQIIKTNKFPKKASSFTQPTQDHSLIQNYHSFLDIRQYEHKKHIFKYNGRTLSNNHQDSQHPKQFSHIFRNTRLRENILENKKIRVDQLPSPTKNNNNIKIKIIYD